MNHWSYFFSYWIYFYFIFYIFQLISYNPILLIIISLCNNIFNLFFQLSNIFNDKLYIVLLYLNISLHFIPFLYLINKSKNKSTNKSNNNSTNNSNNNSTNKMIIFSVFFFIIYLFYLRFNNVSMNEIYNTNNYNNMLLDNFITYRFHNNIEFMLFICITAIINYYYFYK